MLKILPLYLTNKEERFPKQPLGPFPNRCVDLREAACIGRSDHVDGPFWHAAGNWMGARILIDPVWDERASPVTWGGPKRFFAPPLTLEEFTAAGRDPDLA